MKKFGLKISKTRKNNPEIMKNTIKKRNKIYNKYPEIMKDSMKKRNRTYEKNPNIIQKSWTPERRKQSSIKAIKQMFDPNSLFGRYDRRGSSKNFIYKNLKMRSSWEIEFAKQLDKNKIVWEYEKERFCYDGIHHYIPDFYLVNYNLYIDVKPKYFKNQAFYKVNSSIKKFLVNITLLDKSEFSDFFLKVLKSGKIY